MARAIIMAGGEGTRLRPLTCIRAKPMVPVINKPAIEHSVKLLKSYGITDITLSIYTLPENFQNYFGDGSELGVPMRKNSIFHWIFFLFLKRKKFPCMDSSLTDTGAT